MLLHLVGLRRVGLLELVPPVPLPINGCHFVMRRSFRLPRTKPMGVVADLDLVGDIAKDLDLRVDSRMLQNASK